MEPKSPESALNWSSEYAKLTKSPDIRPEMETSPFSSHIDPKILVSASMASGTAPPYIPLWTAWSRVLTSNSSETRPLRVVVIAGTSVLQLPESATIITSDCNLVLYSARKFAKDGEPASSSPSIKTTSPRSKSFLVSSRSAFME